jgi:hypothetical protein
MFTEHSTNVRVYVLYSSLVLSTSYKLKDRLGLQASADKNLRVVLNCIRSGTVDIAMSLSIMFANEISHAKNP